MFVQLGWAFTLFVETVAIVPRVDEVVRGNLTASSTVLWHFAALLGVYHLFFVLNLVVNLDDTLTDLSCLLVRCFSKDL